MEWRGAQVLVTGAAGMTGRALVAALLGRGASVRGVTHEAKPDLPNDPSLQWMQGDLTDKDFCRSVTQGVDMVFHLASVRRNVAYHHEHADEVAAANITMSEALASVLGDSVVPVIFFSTANIPPQGETDETMKDGYIRGKMACEDIWKSWAASAGAPLLIVRPVNMYGPHDFFSIKGNVIPALIVKAQAGDTLTVWGDGTQERHFLYVEDIPAALLRMIDAGEFGSWYLYPNETLTIGEIATKIRDAVNPMAELDFDTSHVSGASNQPLGERTSSLISFEWTPFDRGLRLTLDWWHLQQASS